MGGVEAAPVSAYGCCVGRDTTAGQDRFVAYAPGGLGSLAATLRDVAIGALLGAGVTFVIALVLGILHEQLDYPIEDLGFPNDARVLLGVVSGILVISLLVWPLAHRAEQIGVLRAMHRGAERTPHDVPPRYQRVQLGAGSHNAVMVSMGWVLAAIFGLLAVISFFVMFFENDGGVGVMIFGASALIAIIGVLLIRANAPQGAANRRLQEASGRAAQAWARGAVVRADNAAAARSSRMAITPIPRFRGVALAGSVVTWPGSALMVVALFVLTAWQPNDALRRVSTPPLWLQETLYIWIVLFAVGLGIAMLGSAITGLVVVLRVRSIVRMLRLVEVRRERPPRDDLGVVLGDDPAPRRWARTLIAAALPLSVLTYAAVHAARLDIDARVPSAWVGGILLAAGLAGSVLAVSLQAGIARRVLAGFGVRDAETQRTDRVLEDPTG
jgi:hypothetical protein